LFGEREHPSCHGSQFTGRFVLVEQT